MRRIAIVVALGAVACRPTFPVGATLGVAGSGSDNRIWWPAATEVDDGQAIASYRIDVDGVPVATVAGDARTCALAGLPAGTHDVRVTAFDTAGEWSAAAEEQGSVVGQVVAGEPTGGPATCIPTTTWSHGHGYPSSTSVSADGRRVASFSDEGPYVWDRSNRSGRLLARPTNRDAANPPDISADGRFVAFVGSSASSSPPEGEWSILVWDTATDTVDAAPAPPAGHVVLEPAVSGDGRFVTYTTLRADASPWEARSEMGVWLWDRQAGHATAVSPPDVVSGMPDVSADGTVVVFSALAAAGDTAQGASHITTYDVASGALARVPHALPPGVPGGARVSPAISADGGTIVFEHQWTRRYQLVVWERSTGASTGLGPPLATYWHRDVAISGDGSTVVFDAPPSAVLPGDPGSGFDVFLWDRAPDRLVRVTDGDGLSRHVAVSHDGGVVTFASSSSNLLGPDERPGDLYAWDRTGQPR